MAFVQLRLGDAESYSLPEVCMRCGAPAVHGETVRFDGHAAGVGPRHFDALGAVFHVFKAVWTLKSLQIRLPLCGRHRFHFAWRRWCKRTYLLLALTSFAVLCVLGEKTAAISLVFLGWIFWLILNIFLSAFSIQVSEIGNRSISLCGVSPIFVAAYDEWIATRQTPSDEKASWEA